MTELLASQSITLCVSIFILKQFAGDFLLQTKDMAVGKERQHNWILPLTAHAGVHGALTLIICVVLAPQLAWLALVDFAVHFIIDRSKAVAQHRFRLTTEKPAYWWLFGTDQTLHHLTHLAFAVTIAAAISQSAT